MKVYIKKGNTNYKEKKLVSKLQEALAKKIEQDPTFENSFKPATNFEELKQLHNQYCIDEVDFEDVPKEELENNHKEFRDNLNPEPIKEKPVKMAKQNNPLDDDYSFIDPLNREEPIIRDYVVKDEFPNQESASQASGRTSFDEPMSFKESFEIPASDFTNQDRNNLGNLGSDDNKGQGSSKKQKNPPVNPDFGDMQPSKQKKSTRKFAKYIVEAICTMSEKGFVWFANKDITEAKLTEYEVNGEMDLNILITLQEGQQATVKEFFLMQCMTAEQLSKISDEERKDLAEALAAVLDEKGVAPTPTQELIMVGVGIFATKAIALFALKSSTNSLLSQLRAMKQGQEPEPVAMRSEPRPEPKPEPRPEPRPEPKPEPRQQPKPEPVMQQEGNFDDLDMPIIDNPIQTLE